MLLTPRWFLGPNLRRARRSFPNEQEYEGPESYRLTMVGMKPLRIMAFNIRHGAGLDGQVDLIRTAAVINSARPDIVGLNEVDSFVRRSGFVDQAREIAGLTGMNYTFGPALAGGSLGNGGFFGNVIMSRFPMGVSRNVPLPGGMESRAVLAARLDCAGRAIVFASTHLDLDEQARPEQARRVLAALEDFAAGAGNAMRASSVLAAPTILVGDFNATPSAPEVAVIRGMLRDACEYGIPADLGNPAPGEANSRSTYPAGNPAVTIDYVFVSPEWRVLGWRVPWTDASDHRPLIADVALEPNTN